MGRRVLELAPAMLIGLLVLARLAYHATYLSRDPFALATFSDGQLYEQAARDLIANPPLGTRPFYLQGAYAVLLALPLAATGSLVAALLLQLVLAGLALFLLHRAASERLGALAGGLATIVALANPELAFYENKYLSVSLGATCNMLALFALCRLLGPLPKESEPATPLRPGAVLLLGLTAGLSVLGRPNMLLALPFYLAAVVVIGRSARAPLRPALLLLLLGFALALAPMALRNQLVMGSPDILPSHGGAIPFYIGNNPDSNGRWNTAGGLLTGQVSAERRELAARLGLRGTSDADLDRAIAGALQAKALAYVREQPLDWLGLELRKLWYTVGNHRFVRDYDLRGEAELIGGVFHWGLPFGAVLALGTLGFSALVGRARRERAQRARLLALGLGLGGQIAAVLAANLIVFTSAQNRMPLAIPLAFVAGPGLLALAGWGKSLLVASRATKILSRQPAEIIDQQGAFSRTLLGRAGRVPEAAWRVGIAPLAVALLLFAQSFWPRLPASDRPSSVHYYNLATVEEALGRHRAAAEHYERAVARNPKQPMFHYNHARVLLRLGRPAQARAALDRLDALPELAPELRAASSRLRQRLDAR